MTIIFILKNMINHNSILKLDNDVDLDEKNIELPVKKKKGRKSKQTKLLELEELEKNKVPIKLFPTLNEKIFDVVEINGIEYFLDTEFGILYNDKIKQIGFKKNGEYIMYDDVDKQNKELEIENNNIKKIIEIHK